MGRLVPQVYKKRILIHLGRKVWEQWLESFLLLDRTFKSPIFYPKAGSQVRLRKTSPADFLSSVKPGFKFVSTCACVCYRSSYEKWNHEGGGRTWREKEGRKRKAMGVTWHESRGESVCREKGGEPAKMRKWAWKRGQIRKNTVALWILTLK